MLSVKVWKPRKPVGSGVKWKKGLNSPNFALLLLFTLIFMKNVEDRVNREII